VIVNNDTYILSSKILYTFLFVDLYPSLVVVILAMKTALPQVKTFAMRQNAADILRNALLEGRFSPGEGLSEVELASQLNVSRVPVREALLLLSQEGLVIHSQNRGFAVIELSEKDRSEIEQVRLPLESLALSLARQRASAEDLNLLERLKDNLLQAFGSQLFVQFIRDDIEFHRKIWETSGNAQLSNVLKRLMIPYFTYHMVYKLKSPELTEELLKLRHQMYLDFLKGQCSRSAEECVRFHLG